MKLHIKTFRGLTKTELYNILRLRAEVFVVEQDCPCLDPDGEDSVAFHLWLSDGEKIAAYVRAFAPGVVCPEAKIGRVITALPYRGQGLGAEIMRAASRYLETVVGASQILVEAQSYAQGFYEKCGFRRVSAKEFPIDNIPHVRMIRTRGDLPEGAKS